VKEETNNRWEETVRNYLYKWGVRHNKYPHHLWHYTSIAGVKGLLSEGKLWFSNAAFLNDSTELSYAIDVEEEVIKQRIENKNTEPLVRKSLEYFLAKIKRGREYRQEFGFTNPSFVACFCKEGDSLHLWRAYTGNGRGYSIGFLPNVILSKLKPILIKEILVPSSENEGTRKVRRPTRLYKPALREIIYEETEQKKLLNNVLDSFSQIVVDNKSDFQWDALPANFIWNLHSIFNEYLSCFKHPAFKEEREWRFIYSPDFLSEPETHDSFDRGEIEYRESGGYIVPYFKVNISEVLESAEDENAKARVPVLRLPFESIISGPGLDGKLARASLNSFILRKGYLNHPIHICHSSVPLRNM
jgi:Protein of unknown function (DUF2971)